MSYDEDRKFESICTPYYLEVLSKQVFPGSVVGVNQKQQYDNRTLDQGVSIDAFIKIKDKPDQSIQMKVRRADKYKYFNREKDFVLNIRKVTTGGKLYLGDYYKCQTNLFMYGYANHTDASKVTGLLYWSVINYAKLRDKFLALPNGYNDIPNVKSINYTDGDLTTHFIVIPWTLIEDCLISTSETYNSVLF